MIWTKDVHAQIAGKVTPPEILLAVAFFEYFHLFWLQVFTCFKLSVTCSPRNEDCI